jgi:hypothetical protein
MRKFLIIGFFGLMSSFGLFFCGLHEFYQNVPEDRMVEALQEALFLGSQTAAKNLGDGSCAESKAQAQQCITGYLGNKLVEIALPDSVKMVLDKINTFTNSLSNTINGLQPDVKSNLLSYLGSSYSSIFDLGHWGDSIKVAMNRGAEKAAPQSVEVFKNAIFGMGFTNAKGILMGNDTAATTYLHSTTFDGLKTSFKPIIREPLKLLDINKYWKPIAQNYKAFASIYEGWITSPLLGHLGITDPAAMMPALPLPNDDTKLPDDLEIWLSEYTTGEALNGLFKMVGQQESKLRADPIGAVKAAGGFISDDAVGDLLVDVFGRAKNNML